MSAGNFEVEAVTAAAVNAVGIEVAVLDVDGVIVSVNRAWEQFREANGGDPDSTGVGASYLAACERAGGEPGAADVAAAIHRALAGELASAEVIEIPCHSPAEHRWFDVLVSGRTDNDGNNVGATVVLSPLRKPLDQNTTVDADDVTIGAEKASIVRPLSDIPEADGAVAWAMVEASPDALVMADEHGVIELVNGQAEVLFGYDRGDLLGRPVEILLPEQFAQVHTAHRTRFRVAPETRAMGSGMDLRARRADGSEIPVEVSLSPLRVQGQLRVIAAVRDISARVASDADARRIRNGVDSIRDGVYMFPADSLEFVYVNEGAAVQTSYAKKELLGGMTPLHMAPEFTRHQFRALLAPLIDGSTDSLQFETIMRTRSGADVPVEVIMDYPPVDNDQDPVVVAVVRDITDRIDAEHEALIIQHSVNSVSDAVFVCDEDTLEFVHVNQGAVDLHGYTRAELLAGMTPADLAPGLSLEKLTAAVNGLESSPEASAQLITEGVSKDGSVLTVDVRINWPAPSSLLARRPVVAVVRDISAVVAADAARRRQQALVAALSEVRLTMLRGSSRAQGLQLICELVRTTLDAAAAVIVTPTGSGDELGIEAEIGLADDVRAELSFRIGEEATGEVFRGGKAQLVDLGDRRITDTNRKVVERAGTGSIVLAALQGHDQVLGVLIVTRKDQAAPLDGEDVAAIEQFAAAATVAIELAAVRETQNRLELLEDRDRIGRDMHDNVIGRLFSTGMSMQSALSRFTDPAVRDWLTGMVGEVDEAIKEIRNTVYGLRSTIDWGKGVRGQILAVAADHVEHLGFEPTVSFIGAIDELPVTVVEELLATLREAFTNTAKHANARSVTLDIAVDPGGLHVTFTDNGTGFRTAQADDEDRQQGLMGHGLGNMAARAEQLDGHATITSSPENGTTIEWTVPLRDDRP